MGGLMGCPMYRFEHVRSRVLEGNVGIVRISYFGEDAGRKVRDAVESLRKAGVRRLVLDLRNNPGTLWAFPAR